MQGSTKEKEKDDKQTFKCKKGTEYIESCTGEDEKKSKDKLNVIFMDHS